MIAYIIMIKVMIAPNTAEPSKTPTPAKAPMIWNGIAHASLKRQTNSFNTSASTDYNNKMTVYCKYDKQKGIK